MLVLVALGGNALLRRGEPMSAENMRRNVRIAAQALAPVARKHKLVVAHGNGPQVGLLALEAAAYEEAEDFPLDVMGAETEGSIGYLIEQELGNLLPFERPFATLLTMVEVDRKDPAFAEPSKPIGSHMDEQTAQRLARRQGWIIKEDAGRGWRRVVPSPLPQTIVELPAIKALAHAGFVVIACGGGGIPVVEDQEGNLIGVEAVIDKDLASSLLARGIGADLLMVSTGVEKVAINFNKPNQQWLDRMTVAEAKQHFADNQFDMGSMGPKIQAVIEFLEGGGKTGLITNPENIGRALAGKTGTFIAREGVQPFTSHH